MGPSHYFSNLISADSHVIEPYDMWWNALGPTLGDRTLRLLDDYQGQKGSFFYSGNRGAPVAVVRDLQPTAEAAATEAAAQGLGRMATCQMSG
jgi:hypothetical protein